MEAIGEQQLAGYGGLAAVLPLGGSSSAGGLEVYDGDTRIGLTGRLRVVPGNPAPHKPERDEAAPDKAEPVVAAPDKAEPIEGASGVAAALAWAPGSLSDAPPGLPDCGLLLAGAAAAAPASLAGADYVQAADFAGQVEDLSRTVEYLQVLAAATVDRTRTQAIAAADTARARRSRTGKGWTTGWDNGMDPLNETDTAWPAASTANDSPSHRLVTTSPADDGCATTAEFLRQRLRIGKSEAHRRLALAADILPATTLTGETIPAPREHLTAALTPTPATATGAGASPGPGPAVSSRAGTIISLTLNRLQHLTAPENLALIEENLTTTAATADPDFLTRVARRWADTIDANGTEPSEEALRHTQGAFIGKPRHGLHHLDIYATTDQYEHLLTVMNTATNLRTTNPATTGTGTAPGTGMGTGTGTGTGTGEGTGTDHWRDRHADVELDRRTRAQKQLDGLVGAAKIALATNTLPNTGGNRPQIIATINYQDLLPHHNTTPQTTTTGTHPGTHTNTTTANALHPWTGSGPGTGPATGTGTGTGNFVFTGPVAAATLRKIACDADIIPALLGTHGEILDLGRKTRLFSPAQRLALTARDQGCTFPNCTIPAPWCEAHHITYWSHNGPTTIDNGALLCSSHHHLIHKEQWTITTINNTPWYTPPKHLDPHQKPQQNHYFKPPPPPRAALE